MWALVIRGRWSWSSSLGNVGIWVECLSISWCSFTQGWQVVMSSCHKLAFRRTGWPEVQPSCMGEGSQQHSQAAWLSFGVGWGWVSCGMKINSTTEHPQWWEADWSSICWPLSCKFSGGLELRRLLEFSRSHMSKCIWRKMRKGPNGVWCAVQVFPPED